MNTITQENDIWYVAFTKPNKENLAVENLNRQRYKTSLPLYKKLRMYRNRWIERMECMFPRYVFVQPQNSEHSISPIRSTKGVSQLVKIGDKPTTISSNMLAHILEAAKQHNEADFSEITPMQPGTYVSVHSGPLKGLDGIVSSVASDRIAVLLEILGSQKIVKIPPEMLKVN